PPIPPGPLRAPTGLAVGHPRSIRPGTRPPRTFCPRHRTAPCLFGPAPTTPGPFAQAPDRPVPFRSGAHPPRTFCPRHRTAPCLLPGHHTPGP
ncbi:hypothetical protein P170DRAFT_316072, partial [Aspergillus steynii IBT 23096]